MLSAMSRFLIPLLGACLALSPSITVAQAAPAKPSAQDDETLSPTERAHRDDLLGPGLAKLKAGEAADAYALFGAALKAYPADLRVLRYAAEAALLSHQDAIALDLYSRALNVHPHQPWPLRLGRMTAEARLERWSDFDHDLADLRAAKKAGDPQLAASSGFVIDQFEVNGIPVQAIVMPAMASHFHTLYRFILPALTSSNAPIQSSATTPGPEDRCKRPGFRPYIDLESDDVDQASFQKSYPDKAAKGDREFSLDTYPGPCSQGLIRFYSGEPSYEDVRAAIIKALAKSKAPESK
jgi:hypothetical protein